ncbi:GNAT family N-acetyltransferase [Hoeflea prorocentri]|uniref:GNAT family N-acetyltransferase n=1 Tax=Hoeflea prorocentri TaxID=1922333 RepID=A0A9X3UHH1_9HYPH|nr:GNAT family N-acetyltransferase [Hoeflea prorocentri]MCY6380767.1 GNAT family N-acetyltransferase [Hoeflea prorocentri]MDA5398567.1 GNAT family N-acetyltransferase [Hoeflea prorocentri]
MSKLDFEIRPFTETDLPTLQEVRKAAFAPVFQSFRSIMGKDIARFAYADAEIDQGAHLDEMCRQGSDHKVYVATVASQVVGFCGYTANLGSKVGEVGLNAVHPDLAGAGIGTAMYSYVLAKMKKEGMAVATVSTGLDPSHEPARRAYYKAGFERGIPSIWLLKKL